MTDEANSGFYAGMEMGLYLKVTLFRFGLGFRNYRTYYSHYYFIRDMPVF